ncbi:formate dehydrogenase subunit alpha [Vibrio sp. JC009]|uniref:formate dehydrogenase subunit alpha n=1 Tax=Vibrio sp. JC009 TaxID=2912314 RepID=UPI0023AE84F3|nr:formate dehydrogenase subunit alpha [Vibrio sp. JC009]WED20695.1 formate dehydrogenase subunit alpha [Vibrio sp. JC009]
MIKTTASVCPYCGTGCGIGLRSDGDRVIGVEPISGHPISKGRLCSKGWSSAFATSHENRVTSPLIREGDGFRKASWDEALSLIHEQFSYYRDHHGPQSVGMISCARATNEDNYAIQKFARSVLKTNNVDHCARICHSPSVAGLKQTLGEGAMTNSIGDVSKADVIVIFGCDPTESHSIIGSDIIKAKEAGALLMVVDPRKTRLAEMADVHLQLRLGTNVALLNGLVNIILSKGWEDKAFLAERCEHLDLLRKTVAEYTPERVQEITGVPVDQQTQFARLYSHARAAFLAYGMGVTQYVSGTNNVMAVSNLALVSGHVGKPGAGINPLRGQNNVQGACDMGCLPGVFPGYQSTDDEAVRNKFSAAWDTTVADHPGMTSLGMNEAALQDKFHAMMIFGEDPVVTDPDQNQVTKSLKKLDCLVVVEMVMTETAKLADVVLPAASFAEKEGTFANCERRVQRVRQAVNPPGECKTDWQMLAELAKKFDASGFEWNNAEEIFDELVSLVPIYSQMSYPRLADAQGLQWPCDIKHPDGSAVLHERSFPNGKARLMPVHHLPTAEQPDGEYPYYLTTIRLHFHYGCGSMTRKSPLLERESPKGLLFMNPRDANNQGLFNHAPVGVRSRRGYLETRVIVTDQVPPGLVSIPYHFNDVPSNQLTNDAQDPVTRMPELKACAVRVEPLARDAEPRSIDVLKKSGAILTTAEL